MEAKMKRFEFKVIESKNDYRLNVAVFDSETNRPKGSIAVHLNEETKIFEAQKDIIKAALGMLEYTEKTKIPDMATYLTSVSFAPTFYSEF